MRPARVRLRAAVLGLCASVCVMSAAHAQFGGPAPATAAPAQPAATQQEPPFDVASKLYEQGRQAEALVTLRQLAEAGDARAQYLVGLDLIEGKYIARDNAQGFAYLLLAEEDTVWGDLVAPRAKEARAVVEPQLSGPELIRADRLVGEFKARAARK
jgi:TPR repeat protein